MNATEIAALCADLLNAFDAADAAADDTALFAVEQVALEALLDAEPASFEGCARKAAALLEWYDKACMDNADAAQVIVDDMARLAGSPAEMGAAAINTAWVGRSPTAGKSAP